MSRYDVTLHLGHSYNAPSVTICVEAANEDEAREKAEELAVRCSEIRRLDDQPEVARG